MEQLISLFTHNWQRKLVALVTATIIWIFVNHSITEIKTIPNIPIRIVNLPADKTIAGLMPNGVLSKRITLTLSGTKEVIDDLEPADIEVVLDATTADRDDWIIQISKKNLISLNPSFDLSHHINQVEHGDFIIKLSPLVTAKIPVTILPPTGTPPKGYDLLGVWPQKLIQTISGPQSEIEKIKDTGLELTFNLDEISKAELDALYQNNPVNNNDEVSFLVPKKWKRVGIPFRYHTTEDLNDPEATNLHIDFLRRDFLPLETKVPVRVFYPIETLGTLNPESTTLATNNHLKNIHGVVYETTPLFLTDVSRLFLEVIREYIEIVIIAAPKTEREFLRWSIQIVDADQLENAYVAAAIGNLANEKNSELKVKRLEQMLRQRYQTYMERFTLFSDPETKFKLRSTLQGDHITVEIP